MAFLTDINIYPKPNPAITAALTGPRMRAIMEELANTAMMLYQAEVAKRSGRLAASAHAHTEIGGVEHDRWIGVLTVGGIGARGTASDYAASHEYGRGDHPRSIKNLDGPTVVQTAARDLNMVLEQLGSF